MTLVRWTGDDLLRRLSDVLAVYAAAMGYPPELAEARRGFVAAHSHRPGFRAVGALGREGDVIGFTYGYRSVPGQWWHDQVRSSMRRGDRRRWLHDCFELVELHVAPSHQGHGLGATLLRELLRDAPGETVLLSTPEVPEESSRAWRLYRRHHFVDVVREMRFPGDNRLFAILGRPLPL
jgi:ribosomal protein S18 acetylase RimI-like enzyme